ARWRLWVGLGVALALTYAAGEPITRVPGLDNADARFNLGLYLLLGLPFFYLLAFCGDADESEADVMAWCGLLGVGLQLLNLSSTVLGGGALVVYLVVAVVYFVYATRVLPGLRVFKHTLRGYSYMNLDRLRPAIGFLSRALELDPNNH